MKTTSVSLLQRLQFPRSESWTDFVTLYTPLFYHFARRLGTDHEEAKDLVQDMFVVLLRKLPEFNYNARKGRFRGWLWTIFKNQWLSQKRRAALRATHHDPEVLNEYDVDDNVLQWQEEEYRAHLVACALRMMRVEFHDSTWKACWAVVVEDRPVQDVADSFDMSINAVRLATSRVLRRLRERLDGFL